MRGVDGGVVLAVSLERAHTDELIAKMLLGNYNRFAAIATPSLLRNM